MHSHKHNQENKNNEADTELLKLEIRRQLFHLFLGIGLVLLIHYNILDAVKLFIILVVGIILSLISRKYEIPGPHWFLKTFERPDEIKKFPGRGAIFFFVGTLLVVKLFPKDIALASIIILATGDSIGHLFGRFLGKTKNPLTTHNKNIEGMIIGTIVAFFAALLFVTWNEALIASVLAMIAETVEFELNKKHVDDNLIVPLVAGTIIYLMRTYL